MSSLTWGRSVAYLSRMPITWLVSSKHVGTLSNSETLRLYACHRNLTTTTATATLLRNCHCPHTATTVDDLLWTVSPCRRVAVSPLELLFRPGYPPHCPCTVRAAVRGRTTACRHGRSFRQYLASSLASHESPQSARIVPSLRLLRQCRTGRRDVNYPLDWVVPSSDWVNVGPRESLRRLGVLGVGSERCRDDMEWDEWNHSEIVPRFLVSFRCRTDR